MVQANHHWETLIREHPVDRETEIAKNLLTKIKS